MSEHKNVYIDKEHRIFYLSGELTKEDISEVCLNLTLLIHKDEIDNVYISEPGIKSTEGVPITIYVNSVQADLHEVVGLISIIRTSITPIHTYGFGNIKSGGFLIYIAGHYRYITPYTTFLYEVTFHYYGTDYAKVIQKNVTDLILERTAISSDTLSCVKGKAELQITAEMALELCMVENYKCSV